MVILSVDPLFPLGGPVSAADVVDREDFVAELTDRLWEGQSVVLAGARRIGKSSVALEVLRQVAERGGKTVSLNLEETSTLREFGAKLAAGCLANLSRGIRVARNAETTLAALLRGTTIRAKFLDLEIEALRHPEAGSIEAYLDEALELPQVVAQRTGQRVVVLLDEFQMAQTLGGESLMRRMRAHFQHQAGTAFLFLGSAPSLIEDIFAQTRRPFYRFATPLDLPAVPEEAWRSYMSARYESRGLRIAPAALDHILERTGGHAYDTMQVGFEAFLLARTGEREIGLGVAEAACAAALEHLATAFDYDLERAGPAARLLLARIAKGQPLYQDAASSDTVRRTLRRLVQAGYLVRLGHGRYAFREPMLQAHLL